MTANAEQAVAQEVEVNVNVNEQVNASVDAAEGNKSEETDQYGRTEAERTVTLASEDAEAVNTEVVDGKWKTYDDALHYVMQRGFAEIKRTREAAAKLANAKLLQAKRDQWSKLLQNNPSLIANADLVASMLKELGVTPQAKPTTK